MLNNQMISNLHYLVNRLENLTQNKLPYGYIFYAPELSEEEVISVRGLLQMVPLDISSKLPRDMDIQTTFALIVATPTRTVNGIQYRNELNSRFQNIAFLNEFREYSKPNLEIVIDMIKSGRKSSTLVLGKLTDNALGKNQSHHFRDTLNLLSLQFIVEDIPDGQILNVIISQGEANLWRCIFTLMIVLKLLKYICTITGYGMGKVYHNIGCYNKAGQIQ